MPIVQKQSPRPAPAPSKADPGSLWDQVDTVRMLLYGASGTGKTTLWATFPGPILALICSGGNKPGELRSINTPEYRKKITPKTVKSVNDLFHELTESMIGYDRGETVTYEDLSKFPCRYKTIVLDHASGFADLVLSEILGLSEIPVAKFRRASRGETWSIASQQDYGQQSLILRDAFRKVLNISANVVIVAQERTFGDESSGSDIIKPTVGPSLSPSVAGWLCPACDYVVHAYKAPRYDEIPQTVAGQTVTMRQRAEGVDYCLRTGPHDTFMTKFRVPKGTGLPECIVNPTFDKIQAVINGESVDGD